MKPLLPERLFVSGNVDDKQQPGSGLLGLLVDLLVAEKSGIQPQQDSSDTNVLKALADRMTSAAVHSLEEGNRSA